MHIEFGEEPGSNDPSDWELTPEWIVRWRVLCDRFAAKAEELGGSSVRQELSIVLQPPQPGQARIRVICLEQHSALLEVGGVRFSRTWELDDDHSGANLESAVYAIMESDTWIESTLWLADRRDDPQAQIAGTGIRWSAWG